MDLIREKWDEILLTVKAEHELTEVSFKTWLQPLSVHQVDDERRIVTILVPSEQIGMDYVDRKFKFPLKVAIAETTGIEYEIEFTYPGYTAPSIELPPVDHHFSMNNMLEKANLNPKYTFDTFVVGSNNRFAHAAADAVAKSPGKLYNPLFLHGGAGLGKTHLMHAIAHYILDHNHEAKVLYVTSETFTNELIDAIRSGSSTAMAAFREKYRSVDVLLVDDIQFIIGKEATQEEFFHTFNDLHDNKKQIILTSDKPPKEIETLEARMRSRFEWGILADISSPDYETRMAILHKKEEADGYNIDDAVINYIASNIKSNIRELEGALNIIVAFSSLENREITVELAEEALRDMISPGVGTELTPDLILQTVADYFHLEPSDITGSKRSSDIVVPRQITMYLMRNLLNVPLTSVGSFLGKKDHSTIIHGIKKIEQEMAKSSQVADDVTNLQKKLSMT